MNDRNSKRAGRVHGYAGIMGVFALATLPACQALIPFDGGTTIAAPAPPPVLHEAAALKHVKVTADHIEIDEKIQFAVNADTILPASDGLLKEISDTIKENAQIKKVEIQGHASSEGDAARNKMLSDLRAKAVMAALVTRGIDANRLTAKGYGSSKPVADNATEDGREKNRRVEFLIVDPAPPKVSAVKPKDAAKK